MFQPGELSPRARAALSGVIHRGWTWMSAVAAIGPDDRRGRRFGYLGPSSCLSFPPGTIFNEHRIHIGAQTIIGAYVSLSVGMMPTQHIEGEGPVIRIGERCSIGRGSHIVGHQSIDIGDDVTTGPYVYVTDQNHAYADVDVPIIRQWPANDPVRIGSGCWLGAGALVLPGSTIGDHVAIAGGSVVRGDVPARCVVAGVPAKVVRRFVEGEGWQPPLRMVASPAPAGFVPPRYSTTTPDRSSTDSG